MDTLFAHLVESNDALDKEKDRIIQQIIDYATSYNWTVEFDNREHKWGIHHPGSFDLLLKSKDGSFNVEVRVKHPHSRFVSGTLNYLLGDMYAAELEGMSDLLHHIRLLS